MSDFSLFCSSFRLKKIPLSIVIKERLDHFFCIADCSRSSLLSNENLMASGIISLRDIFARARTAASVGVKKQYGVSASPNLIANSQRSALKRGNTELDLSLTSTLTWR